MFEKVVTRPRAFAKPRTPGPIAPPPPKASKPLLMKAADGGAPLRDRMLARRDFEIDHYSLPQFLLGIGFSLALMVIGYAPFLIIGWFFCFVHIGLLFKHSTFPNGRKFLNKLTRSTDRKFEEAQEYRRLLDNGLISEDAYHAALKKIYRHLPETKSLALSATEASRSKLGPM